MQHHIPVERFVNLLDPTANIIFNLTTEEAIERVGSGDAARIRGIDGQFAIVHRAGNVIRMARSIGRPMRYFLAKQVAGPCLIVAERMDQIAELLEREGLHGQFHPSYTRMVPAHHVTEIALVGCPDPNPTYTRFFSPRRNQLTTDLDEIGRTYMRCRERSFAGWIRSRRRNRSGCCSAVVSTAAPCFWRRMTHCSAGANRPGD